MRSWYAAKGMTAAKLLDMPPFWLLGFIALVWALGAVVPMAVHPIWILQGLGIVLFCLGVALMFWAIAAFRAHATSVVPHQVPVRIITTGPFARSRNPIYLGDVMVLVAAILWSGIWLGIVLIPAFVWILTRRFIAPEELRMKQNFGPDWAEFAQKTPRWV